MRPLTILLLATAFLVLPGRAQDLPANLFWQHPTGDVVRIPCVHRGPQHPAGDPGPTVPCLHAKVSQHRDGDVESAPCLHFNLDGSRQHPGGHATTVPCRHLVAPHPAGHAGPNVPCTHLVAQHPEGDRAPNGPCLHPMVPTGRDDALGLVFFTSDAGLLDSARFAAGRLVALGVRVGRPRPLNVFHRDPVDPGRPAAERPQDPFWSHYEPVTHSIQILTGRTAQQDRETLFHEMGHATMAKRCVQILRFGREHDLLQEVDPGLALSEGWAHFVGLTMEHRAEDAQATYKGYDWETGQTVAGPYTQRVEFRVGCILWDLWDSHRDGPDSASFPFSDLYRVFSPTGETLTRGPLIRDLDEYLTRLEKNRPAAAAFVEAIRDHNLTPP